MPVPEIVDALVTNGDVIRWARLAEPGSNVVTSAPQRPLGRGATKHQQSRL